MSLKLCVRAPLLCLQTANPQYTDRATVLCNHQMEKRGGNYIQTFYCNLDSDKKQTEDTIKQTLTKYLLYFHLAR